MNLDGCRALTVRQPWAWAIAHGGKTTENRTTAWRYRGPLLIHAGAGWSKRGATDPRVIAARGPGTPPPNPRQWFQFPAGAIVAVAELIDAHYDDQCCRPWGETTYTTASGLVAEGVAHLTLADVVALPNPVPATGRLGLWVPSAHVVAAVAEQIA